MTRFTILLEVQSTKLSNPLHYYRNPSTPSDTSQVVQHESMQNLLTDNRKLDEKKKRAQKILSNHFTHMLHERRERESILSAPNKYLMLFSMFDIKLIDFMCI